MFSSSILYPKAYVSTPEFDLQCSLEARGIAASSFGVVDVESEWSEDDNSESTASADSDTYGVSRFEAMLYYAGVSSKGRGPKLIYRTSEDKFEEYDGPEAYRRLMRVIPVPDSHEFGENGLWDKVRDTVVDLLKERRIKVSSVDFVRFTWLNRNEDREIDEEEEDAVDDIDQDAKANYDDLPPIKPVEDGQRYYTNPTIWIGVLPGTLNGTIAHEVSNDIRAFLDSLAIRNIDLAYREAACKTSSRRGPALLKPVPDGDPVKDVIDNVSVPLSLPISGRKTTMQGTLGMYFHVGDKLYAVTVRHNLFVRDGDHEEYRYHESAPKKEVLLMGPTAFTNYLASIMATIGRLSSNESLETKIGRLRAKLQDGIAHPELQAELDDKEAELARIYARINRLKDFHTSIQSGMSKPSDRTIGFVRWAPPIGVGVAPHGYTRDLCVIELYKEKFKHMIGNVLSLGPELPSWMVTSLMYERVDAPSEFKYPEDGLLPLRGILTAAEIKNPNTLDLEGERVRRVIKRGFATNTTIGTLSRFMSYTRRYFPTGSMESLEVPIISHVGDPCDVFSRGGDSGSIIVSATGQYVGLITGGTVSLTPNSDITYATPFEWVWELVKEEFPGADLYFDNLEAFLADVA